MFLHFAWPFLTPVDRYKCAHRVCKPWTQYHQLRIKSLHLSVASLRQARPPVGKPRCLPTSKATLFAVALLRFNFVYGDFQRWLGGEYTNRFRNWDSTFHELQSVCCRPPPPDLPPTSFSQCKRVFTEGVPLKAHYRSFLQEIEVRNEYDNHPAVQENSQEVETKFAKEEEKSYHVHLPRFLVHFLPGLIINPLQWAMKHGKGRICVDCTNAQQGEDAPGSVNTWIPKPSCDNPDECPPVYLATAFQRHLRRIWRLRATFPTEELRQHVDDIDAAFRRVLYHPDMAVAFAYVFAQYLIIPVGQVFGSRNAPSFFCILSDLRAYVATCGDFSSYPMLPLVTQAAIPPDPNAALTPAVSDDLNPPLSSNEQSCSSHASYVDDNAMVATITTALNGLHAAVTSAYILFGQPDTDRRGSCFAADKFDPFLSTLVRYLGFEVDCDRLLVTWPADKRQLLHDIIRDIIPEQTNARVMVTPKLVASLAGKLQSAGIVAPWGPYLAHGLHQVLRQALHAHGDNSKWWWHRGKIRLGRIVVGNLRLISKYLVDPQHSHMWTSPLGLLIPRCANHVMHSDASYVGIGGWSRTLRIQWRVTRPDLEVLGFNMKVVDNYKQEPLDASSDGLHINPLEFLAAIINLWLAIKLLPIHSNEPTGNILDLFSDNTTCLSWCRFTAVTKDPRSQSWARLVALFLLQLRQHNTWVQPKHIRGELNKEADTLSRSNNGLFPSWEAVITQHSQLENCRICLLPRELLSTLSGMLSSPPTVEKLDDAMTKLLTLECVILPLGSRTTWTSPSSLQNS